jgi:hypothetical protein
MADSTTTDEQDHEAYLATGKTYLERMRERDAQAPKAAPKPPASKVILDRWPTPEENTRDELERYADVLLPGSIDRIIKVETARVGAMAPDMRAEAVAKFLAGRGQSLMDPEVAPSKLANGQPASPVRVALQRYAPELKAGSLDKLVAAWSIDLLHASPERMAGEIVRRLGRPENAHHLASPIHRAYVPGVGAPSPKATAKAEPARTESGQFTNPPEKKRTRSGF